MRAGRVFFWFKGLPNPRKDDFLMTYLGFILFMQKKKSFLCYFLQFLRVLLRFFYGSTRATLRERSSRVFFIRFKHLAGLFSF